MWMKKKLKVTFSSFGILLLFWALGFHGVFGRPDSIIQLADGSSSSSNSRSISDAGGGYGINLDYNHHNIHTPHSSSSSVDHDHYHHTHPQFDPDVTDHYQQQDWPNHHHAAEGCKLPLTWKGKWFQSGFPSPIPIDDKSIGHKGNCLESSGTDKFLFFHASTNCYKCVVIMEHHRNVLQYKESQFCEDKDTLENLCSQIPGDASLYSLFRIDAQPIDCPFKGAPFTFTYNRGHGECRDPVSHVDTCTDNSRLLLRYQACPNVQKTESTSEELECLATWRDGSNHYLIGKLYSRLAVGAHEISNEERYRCFVYETIKNHSTTSGGHGIVIGYKVAQSGDASCTGVTSTDTGARALTFMKAAHTPVNRCKFPVWLANHQWHSLDSKISVKLHSKGSMLFIQEENKRNNSMYTGFGMHNTGASLYYFTASLFSSGSRIICQHRNDKSDRHVSIKAVHTEGCKTEPICLQIYKRHNYIIEMKIQKQSLYEDGDCTKSIYPELYETSEMGSPYITLISSTPPSLRCPNLGKYMASGVTQDGRVMRDVCGNGNQGTSFNTLVVGCDDKGTMEFHSKCTSEEPITSYTCHGNWEESGTKYLIASPVSRSSNSARRYCFIYTQTDGELRVSSSRESCRRNISPGIGGSWAFNLTANGHCAERLTGESSLGSRFSRNTLTSSLLYSVISIVIINVMISTALLSLSLPSSSSSLSSPLVSPIMR